jgi:eukaryotic-like serine/threonine-protein kinase
VHRDVKPGNLLVADETGFTKLADFGIAKAAEQTRITQVGSVLGTVAYLFPEQARGDEAGPASDIYSLGVCAYQFLAGRLPHEYGSLTELALKQQEETAEAISMQRPEVPGALDRAIRLCLEREPANRYASALDLAEALEAGLHGEATEETRRLAAFAADPDETMATQALRTQQVARAPTPPPPSRVPRRPTPPPPSRKPERRGRGRRWGAFLAFLAVLAAIVVVALALLGSDDSGGVQPVDRTGVEEQIDGIRDFLREHTR